MSTLPGIAYLHALGDGGPRSRTQVVVIHATDNTASALNEAQYATHREDETSAHFYSDGSSVYEALQLENIAYGCLYHGNQISVQFELVGLSNHIPDATMRHIAPIVRQVCERFGIPIRKISASQVAAGVKGICGHADITAAFPQDNGDHTDPGGSFPWSTFIGYVNGGGVQPAPAPAPQEDDMAKIRFVRKAGTAPVYRTNHVERTRVIDAGDLGDQQWWLSHEEGYSAADVAVHDVANLDAFGPVVGPDPA